MINNICYDSAENMHTKGEWKLGSRPVLIRRILKNVRFCERKSTDVNFVWTFFKTMQNKTNVTGKQNNYYLPRVVYYIPSMGHLLV